MTRYALILALLVPLGATYHPQYVPSAHFPVAAGLNPCLISAWPMNEGFGLTLNDTKPGGTNTATISSAPAVTWQVNSGLGAAVTPLWNGTGSALATSTTLTSFTGTTPFSISVWGNSSVPGGGSLISTLANTGSLTGWEIVEASGVLEFFIINTYPGNRLDVTMPLTSGPPHYIVVTYDGSQSASGVKMYNDGTPQTVSVTANTLTASAANGLPITFGGRKNGSLLLNGAMAYAEVYNCVVTSGFVASSFAAGPGIY